MRALWSYVYDRVVCNIRGSITEKGRCKMAHKINDMLNKAEGRTKTPCSKECVNFRFPHMDRACVLSEVFSVRQGEGCYEFEANDKEYAR